MGNVKVTIDNKLKKDLKYFSDEYIRAAGKNVMNAMYDYAVYTIEEFYRDYTPSSNIGDNASKYQWVHGTPQGGPKYYRRHFVNFLRNSFTKRYPDFSNGRKTVRAGIELTPYNLDDIYTHYEKGSGYVPTDKNLIFNLVYSGYHGNPAMFGNGVRTHVMYPTPLERLLKRRKIIAENVNDYIGKVDMKSNYFTITEGKQWLKE